MFATGATAGNDGSRGMVNCFGRALAIFQAMKPLQHDFTASRRFPLSTRPARRAYTACVRDVLDELLSVWRAGGTAGVATVVRTIRSAPRQPGATMVVSPDGTVAGSVSGGCVEGAVYELATDVVASGRPELQRYGISDDDAFSVGLTCGGIIDVFAEPMSRETFPQLQAIADDIAAHRPTAVATVIAHPSPDWVGRRLVIGPDAASGSLGSARADAAITDDARGLLAAGRTSVLSYGPDGQRQETGMEVFVASHAPRPRMLVFGAIDFASALTRQAALLGYRVTVCDARPVFATPARFPDADEVVVMWPDRYLADQAEQGLIDARTAICVLTHDPKFDVPVLQVALRLDAGYIGVMGSRRTHDDRMARLREAGLTDAELARLASPIGLDLGARTPEETAVSIAAEIIARRWGGGGLPLTETAGRIHHDG
jgi:xanthine dehydrogenase accessory factor